MESTSTSIQPNPGKKSGGRTIAIAAFLGLCLLLFAGVMPRIKQGKGLRDESKDINDSVRSVDVISPRMASPDDLTLPSNIRAFEETQIFARTNGYLTKRYVDIGSRVKAGDLLAEIASPDVDQQEFQAVADQAKAVASVGQSQADVRNRQASVEESRAEVDKAKAGVQQAKAELAGSVSKLAQQKSALASSIAKVAQAQEGLDQQKASLKEAEAQRDLAQVTAKRYEDLLQKGFVAQEDADQAEATFKTTSAAVDAARSGIGAAQANTDAARQDVESSRSLVKAAEADVQSSEQNVVAAMSVLASSRANLLAARANLGASQANVTASIAQARSNAANSKRYAVLRDFSKVFAPFDGVITLRNTDVGSLVAPGDASNTKLELFSMAKVDVLRIQLGVPQTYYRAIHPGMKVTILVRELPGRKFEGTVFQTAQALDPDTRTLLTEVRVKNTDNTLLPGMYAEVHFAVGGIQKAIRIPSTAFTVESSGPRVIVVTPDSKLKLVNIKIARDFGNEVQVGSGLTGKEQIVNNPTDDMKEGETVKVLAGKGDK